MNIEQLIDQRANENHEESLKNKAVTNYKGGFKDGAEWLYNHILANPSEFGLVKKEDYDRQVHLVNHYRKLLYRDSKLDISEQDEAAMKDMKIVQSDSNQHHADQLAEENKKLRAEILRLHEQQLDVDWEVEADEAGLDKETQEEIIKMADETCRRAEEEDERVRNLELENIKLKEALEKANDALRSCCSVIERKGSSTNWESLDNIIKGLLKEQHELLQSTTQNKES